MRYSPSGLAGGGRDGSRKPSAQIVVCAGGDESADKEQPVRRGQAGCRWKQQTGKA